MAPTLTAQLADFSSSLRLRDVPAAGVARARSAIIDCVGCMLAGSTEPAARLVRELVVEQQARPVATVIGGGCRVAPAGAALANGVAGHALDYDDVSPPMIGHPSVPLVPALLAAAELRHASGAEVLAGYVVGLDVEARLGRLMNPPHYAYGWHATSTLGTLAAACGAGRVLGLAAEPMRHAIGIAASGAGGLRKNFGSMVKPFHAGQAAERGLQAALLAARGFAADESILEGQHGFLDTFRGDSPHAADASGLRFDVAQPLEIMASGVGLKQYACCGCSHTAIDVLLDLMAAHGFTAAAVERVDCGVNALAPNVLIHRHATTGLQGKFSLAYSVAVALLDGAAGPRQFTDERARAADVQEAQSRIHMHVDPELPIAHGVFPSRVAVRLRDGRLLRGEAAKARGMHPSLPLTEAQVEAKFRGCAAGVLAEAAAGHAYAELHRLEQLADLDATLLSLRGS